MDFASRWICLMDGVSGANLVYIQVCCAPLRPACQTAAPRNVAERAKSPNPPWRALLLQPLLRCGTGSLVKHKHLYAS